jgi:transposase-like protein
MEDFGDLKDKPLDFSTKLRLVEESYLANSSVSQVAKRSNLKPATVKKYRYLISKGAPMYPRHGRPPKLDAISVQELARSDTTRREKHFFAPIQGSIWGIAKGNNES